MKAVVNKDMLMFLLGNMWHVADRRSTMRALSCILFRCTKKEERLHLGATNIKNTIQQKVEIEIEEEGGFVIQARTIYEVVKVLPEKEVKIEKFKDDRIKITSGRYSVKIPVLQEDEFPSLPDLKKTDSKKQFSMPCKQLERLIEHTSFSISDDETRPYINGALWEVDKNVIKMVTTDGHRLTIYKEEADEGGKIPKNKVLIPLAGIVELRRFLAVGEENALVTVEAGTIHFQKNVPTPDARWAEILLSIRMTDSEFPPYESVIPRSNDKVCICNRQSLLEAIKRVSVLSSERLRTINIHIAENSATLRAEYADVGDTEEVVEVGYTHDPLSIGFNSTYLIQVLSAMDDEQIEIRFGGELDGALFKPIGRDDFLGIVMPVRL